MTRIDRLGWTAGLSIEAYGVRLGIRTNDVSVADRLEHALPPGWKPADTTVEIDSLFSLWMGGKTTHKGRHRFNLLYEGIQLRERTLDDDKFFESLETSLLLAASLQTESFVFVHAGVVEWGGVALVFPGRSGIGKTTLVEALVRAGATYYSDEMAVFDAAGRVLPFPRSLRIRTIEGRRRLEPSEIGGTVGSSPIPLGAVVVTSYSRGVRWRPAGLTSARCLMALFDNAVAASRDPELVLGHLEKAVAGVGGLKGRRGEADSMVEVLARVALEGRPDSQAKLASLVPRGPVNRVAEEPYHA
jgi:hypothetical protein